VKPKIYGIKNCDTMKKAFAALEAREIAYDFHDYKKDGVPPGKLAEWAKRVGWEKLANTRGPTWRNIPDVEKAGLTEARALALLERHSSAIKRPVLEAGGKLFVGFDAADYQTF
jgi:arsenate reductase (glutaredoxin)